MLHKLYCIIYVIKLGHVLHKLYCIIYVISEYREWTVQITQLSTEVQAFPTGTFHINFQVRHGVYFLNLSRVLNTASSLALSAGNARPLDRAVVRRWKFVYGMGHVMECIWIFRCTSLQETAVRLSLG